VEELPEKGCSTHLFGQEGKKIIRRRFLDDERDE
jgi:hypothetical protein